MSEVEESALILIAEVRAAVINGVRHFNKEGKELFTTHRSKK